MLQQAGSSLLTEESMYTLLQQDSMASPLSYRWSLPPSNLLKSALGRAAWLSDQVKRWQQVPLSELQACLKHILGLLPPEMLSSENQRLWQMQPSVVLTFCRAMVAPSCLSHRSFETLPKSGLQLTALFGSLRHEACQGLL